MSNLRAVGCALSQVQNIYYRVAASFPNSHGDQPLAAHTRGCFGGRSRASVDVSKKSTDLERKQPPMSPLRRFRALG